MPISSKNKGYENLAASIDPKNETFNQSYSKDFDSSEAPTFLGCFKLPVPPAVRRPQKITCEALGRLKSHQSGIWIETPFQMQKTKALRWLFPECVRRVEKCNTIRQAYSYFGGYMLRKYQGENLRSDLTLHIRSLPQDLVTGGIPHASSRQLRSCTWKKNAHIDYFQTQIFTVSTQMWPPASWVLGL